MIPSSHLETYLSKHQRCACMCRSGGERNTCKDRLWKYSEARQNED